MDEIAKLLNEKNKNEDVSKRPFGGKYADFSVTVNEDEIVEVACHYYVEEWNGEDEEKSSRDEWDFVSLDSIELVTAIAVALYGDRWRKTGYKMVAGKIRGDKFSGMSNIEYKSFGEDEWKYWTGEWCKMPIDKRQESINKSIEQYFSKKDHDE